MSQEHPIGKPRPLGRGAVTIEQALELIDETVLQFRQRAVLAEGEAEIRAEAGADALQEIASEIRRRSEIIDGEYSAP